MAKGARVAAMLIGALVLSGCTTAASVTQVAVSAGPTGTPPAPALAPASASATAVPVASAPASSGTAGTYACDKVVSNAEIQQATGVGDLALVNGAKGSSSPGLTDCGYFGRKGALYVQVTVWTGPAKVEFDQAWAQALAQPGAEAIPGIGDAAAFGASGDMATGGAKVGAIGITVAFQAMSTGGIGGIDLKGAAIQILKLVVGRV